MLLDYILPFEGTAYQTRRIVAAHGDSFNLTAKVTNQGRKINLSEYELTAIFQPDYDVGQSELYRPLGVTSDSDGNAVVSWIGRTSEIPGASSYKIWLKATKDGEITYPAVWELFLEHSPGFEPIIIDPTDPSELSGNVVFTPALGSEFSDKTQYATGDLVAYHGSLWICTADHLGEWDSSDFQKTSVSDTFLRLSGGTLSGMLDVPGITIHATDGTATLSYEQGVGWRLVTSVGETSHFALIPPKDGVVALREDIPSFKFNSPICSSSSSGEIIIFHETTPVSSGSYGESSNKSLSFGQSFKTISAEVNGTGHVVAMAEHEMTLPSYGVATSSSDGLMGASDKEKLDSISSGAQVNSIETITVNGGTELVSSSGKNVDIKTTQADWSQSSSGSPDFIRNKPGLVTSSSYGFMAGSDKEKLDSISSGAQVNSINTITVNGGNAQVSSSGTNVDIRTPQPDWTQASSESPDFIRNKPGLATSSSYGFMAGSDKEKLDSIASGAQVNTVNTITVNGSNSGVSSSATNIDIKIPQPDWSQTSSASLDFIKNKPGLATSSSDGFMSKEDFSKLFGISSGAQVNSINTITVNGGTAQVSSSGTNVDIRTPQPDWSQSSSDSPDFIRNKPGNATSSSAGFMSKEDFAKLSTISSYAQVNVIETIEMNSSSLTPSNKKITIPVDSALDANSQNPLQNKAIAIIVPAEANSSNTLADKEWVDSEIDSMAAYYITKDAEGHPFETHAELASATVFYSNGAVRTPTRNDYCVVLSDETNGGAEYRYIYAGTQWEPQYPIETNDYEALANKPKINGKELSGSTTASDLGLVSQSEVQTVLESASSGQVAAALSVKEALESKLFSEAGAPAFSSGTTYLKGSLASYGGLLYKAVREVSSASALPSDDTYDPLTNPTGNWDKVSVSELLSEISSSVSEKADAQYVYGLSSALSSAISEISSAMSGKADLSALNGMSSAFSSGIASLEDNKADSSAVSSLVAELSSVSSSLGKKLDSSTFADYESSMSGSLAGLSSAIGTKAASSTVSELASSMFGKADTSALNGLSSSVYDGFSAFSSSLASIADSRTAVFIRVYED